MTRIAIPHTVSSRAFTAAGDMSRITSTLSGSSTFQALCSAEQARVRVMNEMRALAPEIRRMKQEAREAEREAAKVRKGDGFAIPA